MNRSSVASGIALFTIAIALPAIGAACGSAKGGNFFGQDSGSGAGNGGGSGAGMGGGGGSFNPGDTGSLNPGDTGTPPPSDGGGAPACPPGATCNVACSGGGMTTTITGKVVDPAGKNPLYNVVAYVPAGTVEPLPSGVPTGAAACSCSSLFSGSPSVYAFTDTSGNFTIENAPVGQNLPLVVQIGKWRVQTKVNVTQCTANSAGTIAMPKNKTEGDIPNIAVSTGGADSLECLLRRIGLDASEYVPGASTAGHVHIFNGGGSGFFGGGGEANQMAGAPSSSGSGGLWDSVADLMKNDIVLLSCEGQPTSSPNTANLEQYLNQGGRAFASHFHYAWFAPSSVSGGAAPADWGNNLASWETDQNDNNGVVSGTLVTTLTGGGSFPKGLAFQQWLTNVNALGQTVLSVSSPPAVTAPSGELGVAQPRFNANVTNQKASQSWLQADNNAGAGGYPTMYFSFDTPVNAPVGDAGAPQYCGRAVFSGLHVGGASYDTVNVDPTGGGQGSPPPAGCDTTHGLSPQEAALEFMLFDLSSCVVPENIPPQDAGMIIPR